MNESYDDMIDFENSDINAIWVCAVEGESNKGDEAVRDRAVFEIKMDDLGEKCIGRE